MKCFSILFFLFLFWVFVVSVVFFLHILFIGVLRSLVLLASSEISLIFSCASSIGSGNALNSLLFIFFFRCLLQALRFLVGGCNFGRSGLASSVHDWNI